MNFLRAWQVVVISVGLCALTSCANMAPLQSEMLDAEYQPPSGEALSIPFTYESRSVDRSSGMMFTTLGRGGARLRGPYTRVEASTKGELVTEVWNGFGAPVWSSWAEDGSGNWVETGVAFGEFARFYTDKVVAYLKSDDGMQMRCQLWLGDPAKGMLKGGTGTCQVSNGGSVSLSW